MFEHASGGPVSPGPQEMLAWAEFYAFNLGWVIMPIHRWTGGYADNGRKICSCELTGAKWRNCNPDKPGKHPWLGWKQTPMETPEQGYSAWRGIFDQYGSQNGVAIGVRTGSISGFFAVDLDIGTTKNGVADLEAWMAQKDLAWGDMATLSATTGGGGCHLLYRYPKGVDKITTVSAHPELGQAVDIKGDGGFILVAPSVHASGRCYTWREAGVSKELLRDAPQKLISVVEASRQRSIGSVDTTYTPTLEELKDYGDTLSRRQSKRAKDVGKNMLEALAGRPIAEEGGAHDAYRDIMYFVAKQWPTCNASAVLQHFQESVAARFAHKGDASTDMDNLLDSMVTAIGKANEEAQQWTGKVALNDQGKPTPTDANMVLFFEHHPAWKDVLGYNARSNRPVYLRAPPIELKHDGSFEMTRDRSWISLWLQDKAQMVGRITSSDMQSAMTAVSRKNSFDPLLQELLRLRGQWDNVPRLDTVFQRVGGTPDSEWARIVGSLWFKSLVARILWPGCKCDTMLILEGLQGYRKSSFFSHLLPDRAYFSDSLNKIRHDVESIRLIHSGPAIFELGELSGLRKQEVEEIKAFLSADHDDLRPLYESYRRTPRRCIFVGTTNRDDYLRDETGGRRFWPIRITRPVDIDLVLKERAQWFAEALYRIETGERWYLEDEREHNLAAVEQNERYEEDIWFGTVRDYLAPENRAVALAPAVTGPQQMSEMVNAKRAGDFVTTMQVAEHALKLEIKNARTAEGARINKIFRKLGWHPARTEFIRGWRRPEKSPDITNAGSAVIVTPS